MNEHLTLGVLPTEAPESLANNNQMLLWVLTFLCAIDESSAGFTGAQLTSAEVLLVHREAARAPDGSGGLASGEHLCDLARWDGGHWRDGVLPCLLVTFLVHVDDGVLREAEVSAKVVDTLHPPFAGVFKQHTLINV